MLTVNLGPLAAPIGLFLIFVALLVGAVVGRAVGRAQKTGIGYVLTDMLIAAVLVARIAFVATWFDIYRSTPWSMLDIRDGGFTPWAGLVAALLVALWQGWRRAALRKPLTFGLAAAALVWAGMFSAIFMLNNTSLPKARLTTLAGEPVDLAKLAAGKPLVINLWATWCPPCRREMPVLAAAQKRESGVHFVFANQGENAATVRRYLVSAGLEITDVLLDSGARIGPEVGSGGLPTTLFYNADGRLVDTHLGQLTAGSLASKLSRLR
ncbi:MAG: TlpA family protein disulfide reductase [Burkholderiales bacterium]|nr:TlpA family protein disulfide reductase [Burkholderiales bacterium]